MFYTAHQNVAGIQHVELGCFHGQDGSMSERVGVCGDPECDQADAASEDLEQEEPLGPYQPNKPVGKKPVTHYRLFFELHLFI